METPRSEQFDDIYFAVENGLEESRYVFLAQNNLPDAWMSRSRFTIAETGFGTGLNFLCAWSLFEETAPANHHPTIVGKNLDRHQNAIESCVHGGVAGLKNFPTDLEIHPVRIATRDRRTAGKESS